MKHILLLSFLLLSVFGYAQDIQITEIMYNPSGTDTNWEWIEIYNSGTDAIDLTGYVFDDSASTALTEANINEGVLEPQSSAILFNARNISAQQFRDVWGEVNTIAVTIWPTLGNGGDAIALWNSFESYEGDHRNQLNSVEQLRYNNNEDSWPDDDGRSSIFLTNLDADNLNGTNWSLSIDGEETPVNITRTSIELHGNSGNDVGSPGVINSSDTEAPVVVCPENIEMLSDTDNCGLIFPFLLPTGTDNVTEELIFKGTRNDGLELTDIFQVGFTTITWIAIDEAGNISEPCDQSILIIDNVPPSIDCGDTIEVLSIDGNPIIVDIELPTASDVCDGTLEVSGIRSDEKELGEPFAVGTTTIIWQTTDISGNIAECEQLVRIDFNASAEKIITAFAIPNQLGVTLIDNENKTVFVIVPFGTQIESLVPTIEISNNATVIPGTGVAQDFSNPIEYIVTAQDDSEQIWTVTVEVEEQEEMEEDNNNLSVTSFMLVNANTNEDLFLIEDGMMIDVMSLPTLHLDIRANTSENVESVLLSLNGTQNMSRTENVPPYALFGDSPIGDYNGNDFSIGMYSITATSYSDDNLLGEMGETLIINFELFEEVEPEPLVIVTEFTLINANTNEDILVLTEGLQIDINTLPTLNLDIRANTTDDVESLQLQLEGAMEHIRTENVAPYALYGDFPSGNYNGTVFISGVFQINAIPYSEDELNGVEGESFSINFELIDPTPILSISGFTLVNADTNEDIIDLTNDIRIDAATLPTLNLNIRANTTEEVESVNLVLTGRQTSSRIENVAPYALYGDFPIGNYNGNTFEEGAYTVAAIGYSEIRLSGEASELLAVQFQIINNESTAKTVSQMRIYPNPASDKAVIQFDTPKVVTFITLYDVLGRVVGTYVGTDVAQGDSYVLDIDSVPEGTYFVKSNDVNGKRYLKQIVVKK